MEITLRPTKKQHEAYLALNNPEIKKVFFGGGAGGGKSWWLCESRLEKAIRFPGYRSFIGREELKRLMQSTYVTWTKVCQHHKVPPELWKLNGQYNYIEFTNGSRIDLLDLKFLPTDPFYERFGSLEYTDGAIEEAGEVHFLAYDVLKSRVGRHMNKEFGITPTLATTGNPKKNWTYKYFYKPWKNGTLPTDTAFIQSLYRDNPYTAEDYGKQLADITDVVNKKRLMFGDWEYEDDADTLFKYEAIQDLFTNTLDPVNKKFITCDAARYGSDKTVIYLWQGLEISKVMEYGHTGIDTTITNIRTLAANEQVPFSQTIVDDDGVGGGVVDGLRGIKGFVNNSSALENLTSGVKENYQNLKTQCYYKLADYVNDHKIAIKGMTEDQKERLTEELDYTKRVDMDDERKLKITSKDDIKLLLGRSPDLADALMMRMFFELVQQTGTTAKQYLPSRMKR